MRPGGAREGIANNDVELQSSTPAELGDRIRNEFQVWDKIIRDTGIRIE